MPTLTRNSAKREQRLQEIMLDRLVSKYQRRVQREIKRAMNDTAKHYAKDGSTMAIDLMLVKHKDNMTNILNTLWIDSAKTFSEHLVGAIKAKRVMEVKNALPPTEIADAIMMDWLRTIGVTKVVQITTTTQNNLREMITKGINDGLSEKEIAKMITVTSPTISFSRGQTIARTETHAAANVSAQSTAKATGINMKRKWVAAGGERTRPTHRDANGQVVGMNEPFVVGGVELMQPGDPEAGSPSETINCRCAVIFVV